MENKTIFKKLLSGEAVPFSDPDYRFVRQECDATKQLIIELNNTADQAKVKKLLGKITNSEIDDSTTVISPFHINYGKNTKIGKNVFINTNCVMLDLGGITIEDNVMIAPRVNIVSEGHPLSPADRRILVPAKIHIKKNVWIGANATITQGVTIGENSIVAAGSVVLKDVPDNVIVGGIPAKVIKSL